VCNLGILVFADLFSEFQVVLKGLLGSLGFKVVRALSGKEAVELMSSRPHLPDLILLDVEMPSESGHQVFAVPLDRHETYTFNLLCPGLREIEETIS
jgi:CheY-like chemotaxis protein